MWCKWSAQRPFNTAFIIGEAGPIDHHHIGPGTPLAVDGDGLREASLFVFVVQRHEEVAHLRHEIPHGGKPVEP